MIQIPRQYFFTRLLLTLGMILSLLAVLFLSRAHSALNTLETRTLPGIELASDIKRVPDLLYSTALYASHLSPGPERQRLLQDFKATADKLPPLVEKYKGTMVSPDDERLLARVEQAFAAFTASAEDFNANNERPAGETIPSLHAEFRRFDEAAQALYEFRSGRAEMWVSESHEAARLTIAITLASAATLALLFLASCFASPRRSSPTNPRATSDLSHALRMRGGFQISGFRVQGITVARSTPCLS